MRMASSPYGSLCVSDLAKYCSEAELAQLFQVFGPLIAVKILQRNDFGSTGLVTLRSFEAADAAIQYLDGCLFLGKRIRVSWANGGANMATPPPASPVINSIYIRYSARKFEKLIRSEDLERIFSPYGTVTEVYIKDSHMDRRTLRQSGLAFVHFASNKDGMHSAFRAISAIDGNVVQGITFRAELSRNLLRQFDQNEKSGNRSEMPNFSVNAPAGPMTGTMNNNMNMYPAYSAAHQRVPPPAPHNGYLPLQPDQVNGNGMGDARSFGAYHASDPSMARPRSEFSAPMHPKQSYCPPHLAPSSAGYSLNGSSVDYPGMYPQQQQQPPRPPAQYNASYNYYQSQTQPRPQSFTFPGGGVGHGAAGNQAGPRHFPFHDEDSMRSLPVPVPGLLSTPATAPSNSFHGMVAAAPDRSFPADSFAERSSSSLGVFQSLRYGLGGEEPDLLLPGGGVSSGVQGSVGGSVKRGESPPLATSLKTLSLLTTKNTSVGITLTSSSDDTGSTREECLAVTRRASNSGCSTVTDDNQDASPDGMPSWYSAFGELPAKGSFPVQSDSSLMASDYVHF